MIFRGLGNTIFRAVNARLQICGLLLPVIFPKKFDVQFQKRLTYMAREKIHSFNDTVSNGRRFPQYAFRYSYEFHSWGLNSVEY